MLASSATLAATQNARRASLPHQLWETPGRTALLELLRQRNTALDALFYDVGRIGPAEAVGIAPNLAAEGAMLVVPPSGKGALALYNSIDDLIAANSDATTIAVAGVGSSALGTAAFARNVADAIDAPVIGVVSGYGLADLMTEALGGYFWFGALNSVRHSFEPLDRLTEAGHVAEPLPTTIGVRQSRDTRTLLALLRDQRLSIDLLIGHSKGNLVISEALFELRDLDRVRFDSATARMRTITVSALVAMPRQCRDVVDIIGEWDWFGKLNSRTSIKPDLVVPAAWHHTNSEWPAHLPVTRAVREAMTFPKRG